MNIPRSVLLLAVVTCAGMLPDVQAQTNVSLGSAANYAVLAGSAITFSGATTITGDVGAYPSAAIGGIGNVTFLGGSNHANDSFSQAAQIALASAYADAAGRSATAIGTGLGGITLTPGVYSAATFAISGDLTLDGNGVYIFQAGSTLDTAIGSGILLTNGAQAANVFWQVGSSATFLSSSAFVGNVLANTSITVGTSSTIDGRVLALNGAVTFNGGNSISAPTAIPEPAATAVLAAGLMGLIIGVQRIRQSSGARARS